MDNSNSALFEWAFKGILTLAVAIIGYFMKGILEDSKANGVRVAAGELSLERFKTLVATDYAKTASMTAGFLHLDNKMESGFKDMRADFKDLSKEIRAAQGKS